MISNLYKTLTVILGVVLIFAGCGKSNIPSDLPKLFPCSITVTMDQKPLDEASVTLVSDDPALSKWNAGGFTDADGKIDLKTNGLYSGAPAGTFKVVVKKDTKPVPDDPNRDPNSPPPRQVPLKSLVDKAFTSAQTTPLSMTIEAGDNQPQTFEVKPAKSTR